MGAKDRPIRTHIVAVVVREDEESEEQRGAERDKNWAIMGWIGMVRVWVSKNCNPESEKAGTAR